MDYTAFFDDLVSHLRDEQCIVGPSIPARFLGQRGIDELVGHAARQRAADQFVVPIVVAAPMGARNVNFIQDLQDDDGWLLRPAGLGVVNHPQGGQIEVQRWNTYDSQEAFDDNTPTLLQVWMLNHGEWPYYCNFDEFSYTTEGLNVIRPVGARPHPAPIQQMLNREFRLSTAQQNDFTCIANMRGLINLYQCDVLPHEAAILGINEQPNIAAAPGVLQDGMLPAFDEAIIEQNAQVLPDIEVPAAPAVAQNQIPADQLQTMLRLRRRLVTLNQMVQNGQVAGMAPAGRNAEPVGVNEPEQQVNAFDPNLHGYGAGGWQ